MIKPMAVPLVLFVAVLLWIAVLCGFVYCLRRRSRNAVVWWGAATLVLLLLSAWAINDMAPKGARTIAQLELPDGRAFVLRHYRYQWLKSPAVRFYARDTAGTWTSFQVIAELVGPNSTSLSLDDSRQEVVVSGAGGYSLPDNDYVQIDGSRLNVWRLPPGVQPGEEDIFSNATI